MIYKIVTLSFIFAIHINLMKAQEWCDSTLTICDSITIDSIVFTDFPNTGNRAHIYITTNHNFLHGPTFVICTTNDSIEFVNNEFPFFGLVGPTTANTFYEFLNFGVVGDTLEGHIVVDNTNNPFPNCIILFKVPTSVETTNIDNNWKQNEVEIFPNPTSNYLTIDLNNNKLKENNIQLIDLMGRVHKIDYTPPLIDLSQVPVGLYVLRLELNDSKIVTKKIIIE